MDVAEEYEFYKQNKENKFDSGWGEMQKDAKGRIKRKKKEKEFNQLK